jgi:hypothetical protein
MSTPTANSYLARRPMILGLAKVLFLSLGQLPFAQGAPLLVRELFSAAKKEEGKDPDDPDLWLYLGIAAILVLLGGAFAGLTIALMGQVSLQAHAGDKRTLTMLHRMKYTSRSSKTRARVRRGHMPQKCSSFFSRASIGFSLRCC